MCKAYMYNHVVYGPTAGDNRCYCSQKPAAGGDAAFVAGPALENWNWDRRYCELGDVRVGESRL